MSFVYYMLVPGTCIMLVPGPVYFKLVPGSVCLMQHAASVKVNMFGILVPYCPAATPDDLGDPY